MHDDPRPWFPTGSFPTRRAVLGGAAAAGTALGLGLPAGAAHAATPHESLRARRLGLLVGRFDPKDPVIRDYVADRDAVARKDLDTMLTAPNRTRLWDDLTLDPDDPGPTHSSFARLTGMALAFATPGSPLAGSDTVAERVRSGLTWLLDRHYGTAERRGNWWFWEIGIPQQLNDTSVLMRGELGTELVERAMSAIAVYQRDDIAGFSAANKVWVCMGLALRGANEGRDEPLDRARTEIPPVFDYVVKGDGFYRDGSFVQHGVYAYTGGYGLAQLRTLTDYAVLLDGSPWAVSAAQGTRLLDWLHDSFEPLVHRGVLLDFVRGREVSRSGSTGSTAGISTTVGALRLANGIASGERATDLKRLAKHWITTAPDDFFAWDAAHPMTRSPGMLHFARAVVRDASLTPRGVPSGPRVFAGMDRACHVRARFTLGVAMTSTRSGTYESINKENLKGWYQAAGSTWVQTRGSADAFTDAYWPTADPYRLPGTTVDTRKRETTDSYGVRSPKDWAGGAVAADRFAAVGTERGEQDSSLTGRLSWFCVDDAVVCVGTGIAGGDGNRVETIVDSRNLGEDGGGTFTVDGAAQPTTEGWNATRDPGWTHLAGTGGYVFPGAAQLRMLRERRTGKWSDINKAGQSRPDTTTYHRTYLTQWFDHGTDPSDASYRYVLLPGASTAETASWHRDQPVTITAATPSVHAVNGGKLRLKAANFWTDDAPDVQGVGADRRCSVVLHGFVSDGSDYAELAVADPTQKQTGTVTVHALLAKPVAEVAHTDPGVTVRSTGSGPTPTVRITVDLTTLRGATRRARFRYA